MITEILENLKSALSARKWTMATAESCTGGLLSKTITDIPGSSAIFECGFITYSNESKTKLLGVNPEIIELNGAVSEQTARAMLEGVFYNCSADIAVSITGVAGPDGGTTSKPVGLVYIGHGIRTNPQISVTKYNFSGNREDIRQQAMSAGFNHIIDLAKK